MKIRVKLRKDKFSARRGGGSKVLDIYCKRCNNMIMIYQKDGHGRLERCYMDRIIYPSGYQSLEELICNDCEAVVGEPMVFKKHGENRPAFNMIQNAFRKKASTHVEIR